MLYSNKVTGFEIFKNIYKGLEKNGSVLKRLAALAKDLSSGLSTSTEQLTTTCKLHFQRSDALFWLLKALQTCVHTHTETYKFRRINL